MRPSNTNAAQLRAVETGSPPPGFAELDPFELNGKIWNRFRLRYEERFKYLPNMSAKNAGDFPERVASLAKLQNVPPLELLDRAFEAWARAPAKEEIGRANPYANFVMRFERLVTSPALKHAGYSEKDKLSHAISAALTRGDHAEYEKLNGEFTRKYLGGQHARPAG